MATCPDENFRNPALAVEAAEKAIALDGDSDYRYLETLAAAHANAGNFDAATVAQKKVIELAPPEQRQRADEPPGTLRPGPPLPRSRPCDASKRRCGAHQSANERLSPSSSA